jgi:hypothetical protein
MGPTIRRRPTSQSLRSANASTCPGPRSAGTRICCRTWSSTGCASSPRSQAALQADVDQEHPRHQGLHPHAVRVVLAVTELVANAAEHAFPDKRPGKIHDSAARRGGANWLPRFDRHQ